VGAGGGPAARRPGGGGVVLTHYEEPWPTATDEAADDETICPALRDGYGCTRREGHEGRHEAGGFSGRMYASWTDEPGVASC
jgi:hypothetical protein